MPASILGLFVLGLTAAIRRIRVMNRRVRRHILIDPIAQVSLLWFQVGNGRSQSSSYAIPTPCWKASSNALAV